MTIMRIRNSILLAVLAFAVSGHTPPPRPLSSALATLVLTPASVVGGQTSSALATLGNPAPAGGRTINIVNGNPAVATMPAQIFFAAGSDTARFTITTVPVATTAAAQITVGPNLANPGVATLTVRSPAISGFRIGTKSVIGGLPIPVTIDIDGPAPSGGIGVLTHATGIELRDATATVPSNGSSVSFDVPTFPVTSATSITLTPLLQSENTNGGVVQNKFTLGMTILPIAVNQLTFPVTTVRAGYSTTGTVRINTPAPESGFQVTLSARTFSINPRVLTIPARATTQTFSITAPCCPPQLIDDTITARPTNGGPGVSERLTIRPISVSQIAVTPAFQRHAQPFTVNLTIDTVAPSSGVVIPVEALGSTQGYRGTGVIGIGPGGTTGSTTITLPTAPSLQTVRWVGRPPLSPAAVATTLIAPPEVTAFTLGAGSVFGGQGLLGNRVTITAPAPFQGVPILFSASPGTVQTPVDSPAIIPANTTTATGFSLRFTPVADTTVVRVTARSYDRPEAALVTADIRVVPPALTRLVFANNNTVRAGTGLGGTVSLNFPAPAGGAPVSLSASPANAVQLPASVTIPAGSTSTQVGFIAGPTPRTVTITATYKGTSVTRVVTII